MDPSIDDVLSYWFPPGHDADDASLRKRVLWWFRGGPDVDREIRERFATLHERASRGELDAWAETPRGRLALVVVLDQFSRNLHRGSPASFAQDAAARKLVQEGMAAGVDRAYSPSERMFFILPLSHSEDLALQEEAVRYVAAIPALAPEPLRAVWGLALESARGHRDAIARFGRHPGRNEVLGRASTPEEVEFLAGRKPPAV